jgi:hypothetical protein
MEGGFRYELTDAQADRLARAETTDWSKLSGRDRTSLGKRYGYIVEALVREIAAGGRAKAVLHYPDVTPELIQKLREGGGRVVITQGRLRGGKMRFDTAEIDFDKRVVELIDLTPSSDPDHVQGTADYAKELKALTGFKVVASELYYVGEDDALLPELGESKLKTQK